MHQICGKCGTNATVITAFVQHFFNEFCNMLKHRGKIFEEVILKWLKANGMSLTAMSKKVGYNPSTVYRHFQQEELPYHIIKRYGKVLGHDFRMEFPDMDEEFGYLVNEQKVVYEPITLGQAIQQRDQWREKYFALLEKHNALLTKKMEGE